jgi:hypothetical protein
VAQACDTTSGEAEIRRIVVQGKKLVSPHLHEQARCGGHICGPRYEGGIDRKTVVQDQLGKKPWNSTWKITKAKKRKKERKRLMVWQSLPIKHEALSSNPRITKKSVKHI